MLYFRGSSIWVAWIRRKYLSRSPLWALNEKNYMYSWMFRKLLKLRYVAATFLRIKIGNGDDTFFWWDPWTPFGPLIHFFGPDGPYRLRIPLFHTVSDVLSSDGWLVPPTRSENQVQLYALISTIVRTQRSDFPQWLIGDVPQKSFSSRNVWNSIREVHQSIAWFSLVWHKARIPKHAFIFVLNGNAPLGCDVEQVCILCGEENETRNYLFFDCSIENAGTFAQDT
ncbi:unnamed protein product [Arabis nemorensis]|uniref:Reverse transcriptase zinc-binding domain-containing protein n=1 Tax=Arabis nemorensis TaxID=586526 RepID=A0A565BTV3_9BRAS|nr:unnamed protein product [Arabis nemorensis]